jgi:rubrerythrin
MSYDYKDYGRDDDFQYQWERNHEHRIIWKCFRCDYSYESERDVNSALLCPTCGQPTQEAGESYK